MGQQGAKFSGFVRIGGGCIYIRVVVKIMVPFGSPL